jgi:hypothetical protein
MRTLSFASSRSSSSPNVAPVQRGGQRHELEERAAHEIALVGGVAAGHVSGGARQSFFRRRGRNRLQPTRPPSSQRVVVAPPAVSAAAARSVFTKPRRMLERGFGVASSFLAVSCRVCIYLCTVFRWQRHNVWHTLGCITQDVDTLGTSISEDQRHVLAMERTAHPGGASHRMRIGSDRAERDGVAWPWKILRAIQCGRRGVPAVGAAGDGTDSGGRGGPERRDERCRWDCHGRCRRRGERCDCRSGRKRHPVFRPGRAVALRRGVSAVHVFERPSDPWSSRRISGRVSAGPATCSHAEAAR